MRISRPIRSASGAEGAAVDAGLSLSNRHKTELNLPRSMATICEQRGNDGIDGDDGFEDPTAVDEDPCMASAPFEQRLTESR